jgi:membrane protein required for colicin V production
MNALDILLLGLLALSGVMSLRLGLVREVFALAALLIGLFGAVLLTRAFSGVLPVLFHSAALTQIIFFLVAFILIHILVSLVGAVISRFLRAAKLGWADHLLGFGFGVLRGAILALLLLVGLTFVLPARHPLFAGSRGCHLAETPLRVFSDLLPDSARDSLQERYRALLGVAEQRPAEPQAPREAAGEGRSGASLRL